jgi:hypothetical protein
LLEGDTADPKRHPIAIALRRQDDIDDARVTEKETLVRRGKQWFRYVCPGQAVVQEVAENAGIMTDTPSLVPLSESSDVYLVLTSCDVRARPRELSEETANEQTVLELIANGISTARCVSSRLTRPKDGLAMSQRTLQKHC